jgi:hypothetical protein
VLCCAVTEEEARGSESDMKRHVEVGERKDGGKEGRKKRRGIESVCTGWLQVRQVRETERERVEEGEGE